MKEEQVTKKIIKILLEKEFIILSFDYPQSGTGILLKSIDRSQPKMNIDIIAHKGNFLYFFENKDRYYPKDFDKLYFFKNNISNYRHSFKIRFGLDLEDFKIITCIGIPDIFIEKVNEGKRKLVDEIWSVEEK